MLHLYYNNIYQIKEIINSSEFVCTSKTNNKKIEKKTTNKTPRTKHEPRRPSSSARGQGQQ